MAHVYSLQVRDSERQVAEYASKLQALEELKAISEESSTKYRGQAEQVIRSLEVRINEAEESRKRAEEALARTVAAAHSKLTLKTSALATAEAGLTEEANIRSRLQQQLEKQTLEHQAALSSLEKQLSASKARELELSAKVTESSQRADDLSLRLQLTDGNAANLKTLLSSPQPPNMDPHTAVAQELERIKRNSSKREAELNACVAEQNHLIRILRHALATASPGLNIHQFDSSNPHLRSSNFSPNTSFSSIPQATTADIDSEHKTIRLQQLLDERDTFMQALQAQLTDARLQIGKLEEQRSSLLQKLEYTPTSTSGNSDTYSLQKELQVAKEEAASLRTQVEEQQIKITLLTAQLEEATTRVEEMARVVSSKDNLQVCIT